MIYNGLQLPGPGAAALNMSTATVTVDIVAHRSRPATQEIFSPERSGVHAPPTAGRYLRQDTAAELSRVKIPLKSA